MRKFSYTSMIPYGAQAILAIALLYAAAGAAQAQSTIDQMDTSAGRSMAETWCASCHVVLPTPRSSAVTLGGPPDFSAIANATRTTELSLNAFLQTPHSQMPDFQLSRNQISSLISYILSLKNR